ncbi:hypothetical protein MIMGU_mgv1a017446mg [Erythranthe guttata]|uniref:Uncharacterized protein n=1 Tax=Erythranthe guttata TaxID=4155 RepID=A0A022PWI8_ERYGU|nr:hypothetical protein MIMGU_mgv1a017446mg [Erythranthe guttata]
MVIYKWWYARMVCLSYSLICIENRSPPPSNILKCRKLTGNTRFSRSLGVLITCVLVLRVFLFTPAASPPASFPR